MCSLGGRLIQPAAGEAPAKAARVCAANSTALREHFYALTNAFLEPLLPFCLPQEPEPGSPASPLASFSHATFLEGLDRKRIPSLLLERFASQVYVPACPHSLCHLGTIFLERLMV